jgi:UPF0042 nucleotide-binding protein
MGGYDFSLREAEPHGKGGLWIPLPSSGVIEVNLYSFGYLHEGDRVPREIAVCKPEVLVDVRRRFRDPHVDPKMRERTGRDAAVRARVLDQPGAMEFIQRQASAIADLVSAANSQNPRTLVRAAFGCAGGRHRSVVIAEGVGALLLKRGIGAEIFHLHIRRPVVNR